MLNDRDIQNYAIVYKLWKEIFGKKPTFKNRADVESIEGILYLLERLGVTMDDDFYSVVRPRKSDNNRLHPWCSAMRPLIAKVKSETETTPIAPVTLSAAGWRGVDAIKIMLEKKPDDYTNNEWLVTLCETAYYISCYSGLDEQWVQTKLEEQCRETEFKRIRGYYASYEVFKEAERALQYQLLDTSERQNAPCIQYDRLLTLFTGYVNNDLESADADYVREVLFDNLGMTEDEARACGFEYLIIDQE